MKFPLNQAVRRFQLWRCGVAPGWQNLASDQLIPTPEIFLRTMFSQLKWCEKPENFSSEPYACADPNQQVTPSSATRRCPRPDIFEFLSENLGGRTNTGYFPEIWAAGRYSEHRFFIAKYSTFDPASPLGRIRPGSQASSYLYIPCL